MFAHVGCKIGEVFGQPGGQKFRVDHGGLNVAMAHEVADQHDVVGLQPV